MTTPKANHRSKRTHPAIERQVLAALEIPGAVVTPPGGRLAEEWFWQAAARLQAQGKVVANQFTCEVYRPESERRNS